MLNVPPPKKELRTKEYVIEQRKRILLGIIEILVIQWIKENPLCGQDIINKIKKEFNILFSSGTI